MVCRHQTVESLLMVEVRCEVCWVMWICVGGRLCLWLVVGSECRPIPCVPPRCIVLIFFFVTIVPLLLISLHVSGRSATVVAIRSSRHMGLPREWGEGVVEVRFARWVVGL